MILVPGLGNRGKGAKGLEVKRAFRSSRCTYLDTSRYPIRNSSRGWWVRPVGAKNFITTDAEEAIGGGQCATIFSSILITHYHHHRRQRILESATQATEQKNITTPTIPATPLPPPSLTTSGHHRQFVILYGYYTGRFQQRLNLADDATPFDLRRGNPESHVRFHSEPAILPGPASQPGPFQRFGFIQEFRRVKTRK